MTSGGGTGGTRPPYGGYGPPYGGYGAPYGAYGSPYGGFPPYGGPSFPNPATWGLSAPYGVPAAPYGGGFGMEPTPPYPGYGVPYGPEAELEFLRGQVEYLEDVLDGFKKRIKELEQGGARR